MKDKIIGGLNCAEAMDLMNTRIASGLLLASLAYGLDACVYFLSDSYHQKLQWASFGISILAALWIFRAVGPGLWNKFKNRSTNKNTSQHEPESYVTETFHKAIIKSWIVTIASLMLLKVMESFIDRFSLPAEFYINGLVFVMLFSASIVFLFTSYSSDEDEGQEDMA